MKMNIDNLLNYYNDEYYFTYSHLGDAELKRWGDAEVARIYLEKYFISPDNFQETWGSTQEELFDPATRNLDRLVFRKSTAVFPQIGGVALTSSSLKEIKLVMQEAGDKEFVLISSAESQNRSETLILRMKYPITVSWEEVMSGGFISTVLFEMGHNDYFIFGKSGLWARYVANDYEIPIDLFSVDDSLVSAVKQYFQLAEIQAEQLKPVIPDYYKEAYTFHL